VAVFVLRNLGQGESRVKFLVIVLFAGGLYATNWGTPAVGADQVVGSGSSARPAANDSPAIPNSPSESGQAESTTPQPESPSAARKGGVAGFFGRWFTMGERIQAQQPGWLSPLATTSGRLKQEFRYDVWRQPRLPGGTNYNFGGGKGLEFIVAPRVQLLVGPPPYIAHIGSAMPDGYADIPLMIKVRLAAAPPGEGDYLLTVLLSATVPGGSNSTRDAVLSPAIAAGKGWGKFDVQTTFGENLPTGDTTALGRQLVSNTALQYRVVGKFWPELEVNSTFFVTGKNARETQIFLTPGLGFGRIHLWHALRFSTAAGMQIAATRFHTYNHRAIFSVRYSF
jgi:hypothetical protein